MMLGIMPVGSTQKGRSMSCTVFYEDFYLPQTRSSTNEK